MRPIGKGEHSMLSTESNDQDEDPNEYVNNPLCQDCQINVYHSDNYSYMLKHSVWRRVDPHGTSMLCIPCVERRLGRELRASRHGHSQTMTIRHVTVEPGGQAVIGNVNPRGRGAGRTTGRGNAK